jgi:hypothetical protein
MRRVIFAYDFEPGRGIRVEAANVDTATVVKCVEVSLPAIRECVRIAQEAEIAASREDDAQFGFAEIAE